MKKIYYYLLLALSFIVLTSCSGKGADLLILNWGDYIAEDLIISFEEEYGVSVKVVTTDSNEQMYSSIVNKTAEYDLVVPSDYMLDQMAQEGIIRKLDYSRLENYDEDMFVSELKSLMESENTASFNGYYIPYFWGSLGIMYNKNKEGVEEAVTENGWAVFFEQDLLPSNAKVGMYSVSRDALACAQLYLGYSLNTKNIAEIDECMNLLRNTDFDAWGSDDLKVKVSRGNLDVALVYSGDFFDAWYADLEAEEGMEEDESFVSNTDSYHIYAPTDYNNVFFDAMAIPNTCTNEDLAYKFLDYMLNEENSYTNAEFVGYCPTLQSVYDEIISDEEGWGDVIAIDAYDPTKIINTEGSKYEVYSYLGADTYIYIEEKFTNVLIR
jgi:spermidine/putrescine-binding protein